MNSFFQIELIVSQTYFLVKQKEGFGGAKPSLGGIAGAPWGKDAEEG